MTKRWFESKAVTDFLTVENFTAPAFVLLAVGILTIVLRFVTDTPIVL